MFVGQSNFLQALGWAVLNSLWQMAFLWVIYQIVSGIYRTASSSQRSYLATSLIIIGFSWFAYTFFSILSSSNGTVDVISSSFIGAAGNDRVNGWMNMMLPIASVTYLVLLLLPLFYFIRNYRYVQAIRHTALTKVDVNWRIFVKNVAARMGIRKPVRVWLSEIVTSPVTIGFIKPVILLPVAALNQLSTQQIEAVLLHELSHIKRYDYFLNLVIRFIQTILYFNPFVKALVKTVEIEREKSCDEMVIQFQYDPHGYATALLMLEKLNNMPKTLAVAAAGKKGDLLQRIEYMLGAQKKQVFSFNKLAGLFAGLLCFIAINALLIAGRHRDGNGQVASVTDISSPLYFFTGSENDSRNKQHIFLPKETASVTIVNHARPVEISSARIAQRVPAVATVAPAAVTPTLALTYVRFMEPTPTIEAAPLKTYEEEQVKEAVEASKKVLEQKQWKDVEKKIADVLTSEEKDELKGVYEKELSKVDWSKMKQRLTLAYDKIDWNRVNANLNNALVEIKMDSVQQVYTVVLSQLTTIQKELTENNLKGIPDTDVTLECLQQKQQNVEKAIEKLQKVKARKIVQL